MFFYTNVVVESDSDDKGPRSEPKRILFRGYKDGKRVTERVEFKPSLFIKSSSGEFKSLHGDSLQRVEFTDIGDMKRNLRYNHDEMSPPKPSGDSDWDKKNIELYEKNKILQEAGFHYYGTRQPEIQFINMYFEDTIEYDINLISIKSIDIETKTEHGAIDTINTPEEITLITLKDFHTKKIVTFGCWDFEFDYDRIRKILDSQESSIDIKRLEKFTYVKCKDEVDLLQKFLGTWTAHYPDVVTGHNIESYDITYLYNRIVKILDKGDKKRAKNARRLSPWGSNYEKSIPSINIPGGTDIVRKLEGISVLDYLSMYKSFSFKKLENYKLDTIAFEELGRRKLTHEYKSFREFYENDPYKFILYNIIDTDLVDELEERMQLIQLVIKVAYEAKINYNKVFSRITSWESILYNHLMKDRVIPPIPKLKAYGIGDKEEDLVEEDYTDSLFSNDVYVKKTRSKSGSSESPKKDGIIGAYVKDVKPGLYEWNVSFDATSLYPSIIMSWNMSPDTLIESKTSVPDTYELRVEEVHNTINSLVDRSMDLSHLKGTDVCMAANGQLFSTKTKGWFPRLIEYFFDQRQVVKKEMLRLESLNDDDPLIQKQIVSLNIKQMALKILLNSLYGAMGNENFAYFDIRIAEGITSTGQLIIRTCENQVNEYMSKINKQKADYCYYCDTDSMHISLKSIVNQHYSNLNNREVSHILSKVCDDVISPKIKEFCRDLGEYVNIKDNKISFKREFIASRGIYTAKKRYCLSVYNSEGVEYDPPKNKIMGLEIVRSSTPTIVRNKLREAVEIILTKDNATLIDYVADFREEWDSLPYQAIAFPRGITDIEKYERDNIYGKGTPVHVKAALLYNYYLKSYNVDGFEPIKKGDRMRWIYLLEPNYMNNNAIGFFDVIPEEFKIIKHIDYDKMFMRAFLDPLSKLTNTIQWKLEDITTLEDLFA